MIRIKTKEEIEILKEGGKKLAAILNELGRMARPGVSTGDLEARACELIEKAGGRPAFKDLELPNGERFPSALCTSINHEIVHAPALPSRALNNGDKIGIDVGMEYPLKPDPRAKNKFSKLGGYYTDTAITVAVGEAGEEVNRLLQVTKECLAKGIAKAVAGNTVNDIGLAVQEHAEKSGYSVVRDLVGHGVGHDYHEDPHVPNYGREKENSGSIDLKPGMVIAIEPMVNIGGYEIETADDGMTFVTADKSLSAQFEHTVAITEDGELCALQKGGDHALTVAEISKMLDIATDKTNELRKLMG